MASPFSALCNLESWRHIRANPIAVAGSVFRTSWIDQSQHQVSQKQWGKRTYFLCFQDVQRHNYDGNVSRGLEELGTTGGDLRQGCV